MTSRPDPAEAFRGTPPASALPAWYPDLLASVAGHVTTGHRRAVSAANAALAPAGDPARESWTQRPRAAPTERSEGEQ